MINIVSKRYWYFALSLLIIVPGLISLVFNGLRPAIAFTSGSLLEVRFSDLQGKTLQIPDVRAAYAAQNVEGEALVQIANNDTILVRSKPISNDVKTAIEKDLQGKYGTYSELSFETVGPEVSREVTDNAIKA